MTPLVAVALVAAACSGTDALTVVPSDARTDAPTPAVEPSASASSAGPVDAVTVAGIVGHLEALQTIADDHEGTRAVGSTGYVASVEYVAEILRTTGYEVELVSTTVPVFDQLQPTVFEQVEPTERRWVDGRDFRAMLFSGSGDVEAPIEIVTGDGCSAADFAGLPDGAVALVQPGPCFRRQQVLNAQSAGAAAVVGISAAARGRPVRPTLITPNGIRVPVLAVTAELGAALADGSTVRIRVGASSSFEDVESVIAQLPGTAGEDVVMLGGHLDSAVDGPGLNDNGSGVALLLETARWAAGLDPAPAVRFAFWGGEEVGLYGSWAYAHELTADERDEIDIYLNLDMVASPNHVTFVYEAAPGDPEMNERVADLFERALADQGAGSEPLDLGGASDHASFADVGIPTGGVYSGSSEEKTAAQAEAFGGIAGEPLDPCYHQPCDTLDNLGLEALGIHAIALATVLAALLAA